MGEAAGLREYRERSVFGGMRHLRLPDGGILSNPALRQTRHGRGRPPILDGEKHLEAVRHAVAKNRQRLSLAKAELEQSLSKDFSERTLVRFLKSLVADINESADG